MFYKLSLSYQFGGFPVRRSDVPRTAETGSSGLSDPIKQDENECIDS